jgi:hypothetical protein
MRLFVLRAMMFVEYFDGVGNGSCRFFNDVFCTKLATVTVGA